MGSCLKEVLKQLLPHGICDFSVRRHAYVRMGLPSGRAFFQALLPFPQTRATARLIPREGPGLCSQE
jgi:hypothetical protein